MAHMVQQSIPDSWSGGATVHSVWANISRLEDPWPSSVFGLQKADYKQNANSLNPQ